MNQNAVTGHFTLRLIICIYLLLFLAALAASGYLLALVVQSKPVLLLGLLKYTLLLFLFLILLVNGLKALRLTNFDLQRFSNSTKNFKWLFGITLLIALAMHFGWIGMGTGQFSQLRYLQIGLSAIAALFCFWSDSLLLDYRLMPAEED